MFNLFRRLSCSLGFHDYQWSYVKETSSGPSDILPVEVEADLALEIVKSGRRSMARLHHPDRGGDENKMRAVNCTADYLEQWLPTIGLKSASCEQEGKCTRCNTISKRMFHQWSDDKYLQAGRCESVATCLRNAAHMRYSTVHIWRPKTPISPNEPCIMISQCDRCLEGTKIDVEHQLQPPQKSNTGVWQQNCSKCTFVQISLEDLDD